MLDKNSQLLSWFTSLGWSGALFMKSVATSGTEWTFAPCSFHVSEQGVRSRKNKKGNMQSMPITYQEGTQGAQGECQLQNQTDPVEHETLKVPRGWHGAEPEARAGSENLTWLFSSLRGKLGESLGLVFGSEWVVMFHIHEVKQLSLFFLIRKGESGMTFDLEPGDSTMGS